MLCVSFFGVPCAHESESKRPEKWSVVFIQLLVLKVVDLFLCRHVIVVAEVEDQFLLSLVDHGHLVDVFGHLRDDALLVDEREDRRTAQVREEVVDVRAARAEELPELRPVALELPVLEIVDLVKLVGLEQPLKLLDLVATFPALPRTLLGLAAAF